MKNLRSYINYQENENISILLERVNQSWKAQSSSQFTLEMQQEGSSRLPKSAFLPLEIPSNNQVMHKIQEAKKHLLAREEQAAMLLQDMELDDLMKIYSDSLSCKDSRDALVHDITLETGTQDFFEMLHDKKEQTGKLDYDMNTPDFIKQELVLAIARYYSIGYLQDMNTLLAGMENTHSHKL